MTSQPRGRRGGLYGGVLQRRLDGFYDRMQRLKPAFEEGVQMETDSRCALRSGAGGPHSTYVSFDA